MAKLTGKQRTALLNVLHHMDRANALLHEDTIAVARRTSWPTDIDYTRKDGAALSEINKHYGSNLTGFEDAARYLKLFLENN